MKHLNKYRTILKELKEADNYRILPENYADDLLDLSTNDYLGLNKDEQLYDNFLETLNSKKYKFSSS